jgi:hypothetical protein
MASPPPAGGAVVVDGLERSSRPSPALVNPSLPIPGNCSHNVAGTVNLLEDAYLIEVERHTAERGSSRAP